jgi:cobalt/nickel transport system permease protein
MHIPDGFLAVPIAGGLAAAGAISAAVMARRAQSALDESRVPLMGVTGAFVFAAQMINFPVGAGTSGHLVGGALLAATLGPAPAVIVMTAILAIQALIFQDGGLLALGANVFNMGVAGVFAGYWAYRAFSAGRFRKAGMFLGGLLSVLVSAFLCLGELALSGVRLPKEALALAVGVFLVTGVLEGLITVAVLTALERMNARWLLAPGSESRAALRFLGAVAILIAAAGFLVASSLPDGLERVAGLVGLDDRGTITLAAPLPDYEILSVDNPWLRRAGAGLIGLAITWLACFLAARWIARLRSA